ncbi:hypothetical protein EW026_g5790 [Hermanssonia centrifuga]|uniref:Methyltransferase domain-containing protein n=1 Tax=Hermanssonia centrifuga TaxID=98765 RepID=A0A4S4KD46_9APHY|nr:hypothetical protein EW026_g5790 [Hermanssonia centrifuga]
MGDVLPAKNEEYGTKEYCGTASEKPSNIRIWVLSLTYILHEWREPEDGSFDWFKSYADVAHIIRELIPDKDAKILMLGCGNSTLSEDMYDDGYKHIVNVDYSGILIEKMRKKHEDARPKMTWHEMDVRRLAFETGSFDIAIDKGTMDAMMTAKGDVWVRRIYPLSSYSV